MKQTTRSAPAGAVDTLRVVANVGRTVLVIDDDPLALKLAERILREEGFHPIRRSDADCGLEAAEKGSACGRRTAGGPREGMWPVRRS